SPQAERPPSAVIGGAPETVAIWQAGNGHATTTLGRKPLHHRPRACQPRRNLAGCGSTPLFHPSPPREEERSQFTPTGKEETRRLIRTGGPAIVTGRAVGAVRAARRAAGRGGRLGTRWPDPPRRTRSSRANCSGTSACCTRPP